MPSSTWTDKAGDFPGFERWSKQEATRSKTERLRGATGGSVRPVGGRRARQGGRAPPAAADPALRQGVVAGSDVDSTSAPRCRSTCARLAGCPSWAIISAWFPLAAARHRRSAGPLGRAPPAFERPAQVGGGPSCFSSQHGLPQLLRRRLENSSTRSVYWFVIGDRAATEQSVLPL